MREKIERIIAVLNDMADADKVLERAFDLSGGLDAVVEVLYVHESPLFDVPDYFQSQESEMLDKERVKKEIKRRIEGLGIEKDVAILVMIDDTPDRIWALAREDRGTLIVAAYHDNITQKIIDKVSQPVLILKNHKKDYKKIALIVNANSQSLACIDDVKREFKEGDITLLYDYRYVVDPSMEIDLQDVKIIQDAQREAFEEVKEQSGLSGEFFIDGSFLGEDLVQHLQAKAFDLVYVCSHGDDFFVSDSLSLELLKDLDSDILVACNERN